MSKAPRTKQHESAEGTNNPDEMYRKLPGDHRGLRTVQDKLVDSLLTHAEKLVEEAKSKLGRSHEKPRLDEVRQLFVKYAGDDPDPGAKLDKAMRTVDQIGNTAELDQDFDRSMANAFNDFDKTSVESGARVQEACDSWTMAVRIYRSEARAAGSVFLGAVEAAKAKTDDERSSEVDAEAKVLVDHFTASTAIATALETYEGSVAAAASELASAFAELSTSLYQSVTDMAVAESTLISAAQQAGLAFWTGVRSQLSTQNN
ncbi:MAG: hypothetical protein QNJ15_03215 [Erythrobacter sp.]|nr:hypothetical protein [Erythrobacter sp.]